MRPPNDFYPTLPAVTRTLIDRVTFSGSILECCAGDGAIASVLEEKYPEVCTNDIDKQFFCDSHCDATVPDEWAAWERLGSCDWVVTNPPFNQAATILPLAYKHARFGVAFLLRLSYLEPCKNRAEWLKKHPPSRLIVLGQPRPCFTGDGKTDSCTVAWMVWGKSMIPTWLTQIEFVDDWKK